MLDKAKKYLFVAFLICQPILDALTCIQIKNNWNFLSISALVRGLFFLYVLYYLWKEKKDRKIIYLYLVYCVLEIAMQYLVFKNSLSVEVANLMQVFYLGFLIMFFKRYKNEYLNTKLLVFIYYLYISLIIGPFIFGVGYYAWEFYPEKSGYYGLFYGANEISAILVIMFPVVLDYLLRCKKYILSGVTIILSFICAYLVGTKTMLLGFIITLLYFGVPFLYKYYKKFSWKYKLGLIVGVVLILILGGLILPHTPLYKNIALALDYFKIDSSNIFSYYGINKMIFSGRLEFAVNIFNEVKGLGPLYYIFGIGKTMLVSLKGIEIDLIDILFTLGILGFIFYIVFMYNSVKNVKLGGVYKYTFILGLLISLIAGHVLISTNVSIYLALLFYYNRSNIC